MLALLWIAGFLWFVFALPTEPSIPHKTDAIVALTGGAKRVSTALELLDQQEAPILLVSGVNPQVTEEELLQSFRHLKSRVTIESRDQIYTPCNLRLSYATRGLNIQVCCART